jgi:hypothetical protein
VRISFRERRTQVVAAAIVVVIVIAVAGFAIVGGHSGSSSASTTTAPSVAPTTTAKRATPPGGVIAPLTGQRDVSGAATTRAALTIKVENTHAAYPQVGVAAADVVYEEVVEGGITRLLAIYNSQVPPVVGPIRSVRRTDQSVVTPIGGIFVYSGGAAYAIASIRTAPVTLVDETRAGDAMFRVQSRIKPHNLFGRTASLFAFGGKPVPPPPLFTYRASNQAPGGAAVTRFHVGFGSGFGVSYSYNATSSTWSRAVDDPSAAAATPEAPRNVAVMFVNYAGGVGVIGSEAQLVGSGNAVVFTGGHRIDGRWIRPDRLKPAQFVDAAGAPIRLTPGQTWVELAPTGTAIS